MKFQAESQPSTRKLVKRVEIHFSMKALTALIHKATMQLQREKTPLVLAALEFNQHLLLTFKLLTGISLNQGKERIPSLTAKTRPMSKTVVKSQCHWRTQLRSKKADLL